MAQFGKKVKALTLNGIEFKDHTREEVIEWLMMTGKPKLITLARWIAESVAFEKTCYAVQVEVSNGKNIVDGLLGGRLD